MESTMTGGMAGAFGNQVVALRAEMEEVIQDTSLGDGGAGGIHGGVQAWSSKPKRRKTMSSEQHVVTTRWACPRDPNNKEKGPLTPLSDCVKCGGAGCQMKVYMGKSVPEEFVFVLDRNENGSSKYMCRECGDTFCGTQSRIIAHKLQISSREFAGVAICNLTPTNEVRAILEPLDVTGLRGGAEKKSKGKAPKDKGKRKVKDETDLAVAQFFYECDIPFIKADHAAFKRMIRSVSHYGEGYTPPERELIADNTPKSGSGRAKQPEKPHGLLWTAYQTVKREQEECIESARKTGMTLGCDGAKNITMFNIVNYVVSTPRGRVFVGQTDTSKLISKGSDFLADDAASMVKKMGEDSIFLTVMDGPSVSAEALKALQNMFPRMLTMRSSIYGWDLVLQDIGRKFSQDVVVPVHSMILHITNYPLIYSVFESLEGVKEMLKPAEARLSVEVGCIRAFFADKNVLKLLWSHPTVSVWLEEREAMRSAIRDKHSKLGLDHIHKPDWWRLVEVFIAMSESAVPVLREQDLDSPNLHKLPFLYDQACADIQQPLAIKGVELETSGLMVEGISVTGREGDGSLQGSVLEILRSKKDLLVSKASLAAAMVFPPYVFQEPHPYEPEGGRFAFNIVAARYYSHDEDSLVSALQSFSNLRNKQGVFASSLAKKLAFSDVLTFFDTLCVDDHKALGELAIKLLHGVGTLGASDRTHQEIAGTRRSWMLHEKVEQLTQIKMYYRLKLRGKDLADYMRPRTVLFDVRQHWLILRRQQLERKEEAEKIDRLRAASLQGVTGVDALEEDVQNGMGWSMQLTDVISEEEEMFLDQDIPSIVETADLGCCSH